MPGCCYPNHSLAPQQVHGHLDCGTHQAQHAQHSSKVQGVAALGRVARRIPLQQQSAVANTPAFISVLSEPSLAPQQVHSHLDCGAHQSQQAQHASQVQGVDALGRVTGSIALSRHSSKTLWLLVQGMPVVATCTLLTQQADAPWVWASWIREALHQ